jgi:TPR repeat protein
MRYAASIDEQGNRSVKHLAPRLAVAVAWSTIAISAVIAGSPEEDFRAGLSAFNGGDFAKAMRLWQPLADRNDARSQAGIGFMYHRGLGVKTDDVQAAFWLRKAAEQGQAEGQLMLGMCRDAALQSLTEDAQLREAFRMVRELRERLGHVSGQ